MARSWKPVEAAGSIAPPAGAYSPAIRAGDFVYVSGQVPKDPATGSMVSGGVGPQTKQVIANLGAALAPAGATLEDVVAITAYLASIDDWDSFNDAYREAMPQPFPTRTTVGAGLHGFLVEISAVAYAPAK